jgi:putative ATPase
LSDLFSHAGVDENVPLAEQLRPQTPDEVIGQQHLLGPGKPLRLAFESGQPHSMILWGPPGVGKTTLARMMATQFQCEFIALSAVFSGIKEVREAVAQAEMWRGQGGGPSSSSMKSTVSTRRSRMVFCPLSKAGCFTFIGATTENPSFEVNSALLSRSSVYVLKSLDEVEMGAAFDRASAQALADLSFDAAARERLIGLADGDARRLLNLLEQVRTGAHTAGIVAVDGKFIEETMAQSLRRFDKGGDAFLRPDLGAAQVGARLQPGWRALLVLPHARWRR